MITTSHPDRAARTDRAAFLKLVLALDAASSAGMGLLLAAAAGPLGGLTNLQAPLLREAGLLLLPFALFVAWLASRQVPPGLAVRVAIGINGLSALESLLLPITGWVAPNGLGQAFVIGQALVVALMATLQIVGWRRMRAA